MVLTFVLGGFRELRVVWGGRFRSGLHPLGIRVDNTRRSAIVEWKLIEGKTMNRGLMLEIENYTEIEWF